MTHDLITTGLIAGYAVDQRQTLPDRTPNEMQIRQYALEFVRAQYLNVPSPPKFDQLMLQAENVYQFLKGQYRHTATQLALRG